MVLYTDSMSTFNPRTLFRVWCFVAPLAVVKAAPRPGSSPAPDPFLGPQPLPEPQSNAVNAIPVVPNVMGWIGSIGGLLGVVSFAQNTITQVVQAFTPEPPQGNGEDIIRGFYEEFEKDHSRKPPVAPKKEGDPPWQVGVQVGLDGTGLKVGRLLFPFILRG